jgi:hypothetical protein
MRRPKPFFRKQTQTWYVQIGRRQINLGRDEKEAFKQYHALMLGSQEPSPDMSLSGVSVSIVGGKSGLLKAVGIWGGNFAFKEAGDEREFPAGTN